MCGTAYGSIVRCYLLIDLLYEERQIGIHIANAHSAQGQ